MTEIHYNHSQQKHKKSALPKERTEKAFPPLLRHNFIPIYGIENRENTFCQGIFPKIGKNIQLCRTNILALNAVNVNWNKGSKVTNLDLSQFINKNCDKPHLSPSVTFGDSSLVRRSQDYTE